jgi:hypothetical protein
LNNQNNLKSGKFSAFIKKVGFAGFLFFFIKGMLWLVVFAVAYFFGPEAIDNIKSFFGGLFR